jgi:hypothetical protein
MYDIESFGTSAIMAADPSNLKVFKGAVLQYMQTVMPGKGIL